MEFRGNFILVAQFDGVKGRLFTAHMVKADIEALPEKNWHHLSGRIEAQLPITPGAVARGSMLNLIAEYDMPKYIIGVTGRIREL